MSESVLKTFALGAPPWRTLDPFLFCVHHDDAYPPGNESLGPAASLAGRKIGMDFAGVDGWRMYHGDVVPGFPRHPHRGFETVTLARRGYIDHSDSLGAAGRFGHGDAQWMTAGRGIVHSEMFPLVNQDQDNPTELFQIWLNLPRASKLVDPNFAMFWSGDIPRHEIAASDGNVLVTTLAGALDGRLPPAPPPSSWAANPTADVAIWTITMDPGTEWTVPPASPGLSRVLYFFAGESARVGGQQIGRGFGVQLRSDQETTIVAGSASTELLMLQGRPIGEPVVQHGPFVMNSSEEIQQAFLDYRRTEFGGWPWSGDGPVHARDRGRFAVYADGTVVEPDQ